MIKKLVLLFVLTSISQATPVIVPNASCVSCHVGKPSDKKLNSDTKTMVSQYKLSECVDCHSADNKGKLTIIISK